MGRAEMSTSGLPNRRRFMAAGGALALSACAPPARAGAVRVFAAASLTDALGALADQWRRGGGGETVLSFAGSGAVARQVQAGAPADFVALADPAWMDRLEDAGAVRPASRFDLVGNRLVVVGGAGSAPSGDPIGALLRGAGRLAMGDPDSVPAGAYARDWLTRIGRWDDLQDRILPAADVRAVRSFVARGEAELGVVYRSDTVGASSVRVVLEPPPGEQPRIVCPAALTLAAGPVAEAFAAFLRSSEAAAVFSRHGFAPLDRSGAEPGV